MPPVVDGSLGSRFWITDDFQQIDHYLGPDAVGRHGEGVGEAQNLGAPITDKDVGTVIGDDAGLTSLASGSDSIRFNSVFCRAKLLAPQLRGENDPKGMVASTVEEICSSLQLNLDVMTKKIVRLNRLYQPVETRPKGAITDDEVQEAKTALSKMLVSQEFAERASRKVPLEHKGFVALANATLGLMKLVREGKMKYDQIGDFMMGEIIDLNKPADILRLAVKTAQKARETFIDREGVMARANTLVQHLKDVVARNKDDAELKSRVDLWIAKIDLQAKNLILAREEASKKLDVAYDIGDGSKGAIDDKLKTVANDLRAFRYDLDRASRRAMKPMESLRRFFDNLSPLVGERKVHNAENRVTKEKYDELLRGETRFANELTEILNKANDLIPGDQPKIPMSAEDVEVRSVAETSADACELTHATNNHVRYYFSGAETKREKFAKNVHKMFDPMVADGGSKKVIFEAGADVRGGVNLGKGVVADARAGGKYLQTAEIKVAKGGGEITVTYFDGGIAEASAEAGVGFDANKGDVIGKGNKATGANVHAGANVGGGRGRTVTYASLDDFIRDCNGESNLESVGMGSTVLCLGKIAQGVRALFRGVKNIFTALGFRIHKSIEDNNAYRAKLVDSGVVSNLDQILTPPSSNLVVKTSEKSYDAMQWGADLGVDLSVNTHMGVDELTGAEKTSSLFDFGANAKYSGEWQRRVHGEERRARLNTFRMQSDEYLRDNLYQNPANAAFLEKLGRLGGEIRLQRDAEAFRSVCGEVVKTLEDRLNRLELDSSRIAPPDEEAKWRETCREVNQLTVLYTLLERTLDGASQSGSEDVRAVADEIRRMFTTLYATRIVTPNMNIPEDIFKEELVDITGTMSRSKTVHSAQLKISYNAGGVLTDIVKDAPDGLKAKEGDTFGKTLGKEAGKTALGGVMSTVESTLAMSGSVTGYVKVEEDHGIDSRPWKNGKAVTCGIRFEPNLPIRLIVDAIAKSFIDSQTDVKPEDLPSAKERIVSDILGSLIPGIAVGELATVYGSLTLGQVLVKGTEASGAAKFFAGPLIKAATGVIPLQGLELGMDIDFGANLEFRFERGRLACFSVTNDTTMSQTVGVRFQAGVVGVGVHIKSGLEESSVDRYVYAHPSVDTMLGRTADILRSGGRSKLNQFLSHNAKGACRLLKATLLASDGLPLLAEKDKNLKDDVADMKLRLNMTRAYLDMLSGIGGTSPADAGIRDRARMLRREFDRLSSALDGNAGSVSDKSPEHEQIQFMEDLFTVITRAYELKHEHNAVHGVTTEEWQREDMELAPMENEIDSESASSLDELE